MQGIIFVVRRRTFLLGEKKARTQTASFVVSIFPQSTLWAKEEKRHLEGVEKKRAVGAWIFMENR